jgi:hypothetical protein
MANRLNSIYFPSAVPTTEGKGAPQREESKGAPAPHPNQPPVGRVNGVAQRYLMPSAQQVVLVPVPVQAAVPTHAHLQASLAQHNLLVAAAQPAVPTPVPAPAPVQPPIPPAAARQAPRRVPVGHGHQPPPSGTQ